MHSAIFHITPPLHLHPEDAIVALHDQSSSSDLPCAPPSHLPSVCPEHGEDDTELDKLQGDYDDEETGSDEDEEETTGSDFDDDDDEGVSAVRLALRSQPREPKPPEN